MFAVHMFAGFSVFGFPAGVGGIRTLDSLTLNLMIRLVLYDTHGPRLAGFEGSQTAMFQRLPKPVFGI